MLSAIRNGKYLVNTALPPPPLPQKKVKKMKQHTKNPQYFFHFAKQEKKTFG